MKNLLLPVLLVISASAFSQQVSGLFQGTLFNDTTKMVQNYELALSEYKGKITGYSYTTFVSNDTFYYGIRRIKAAIRNDELIVEDGQMLVNNYPEAPAKGVKRISVIPLNGQDSVTTLNGRWETSRTKIYYSVPGSIEMKKTDDSSSSALIRHLKELDLLTPEPQQTETRKTAVVKKQPETKTPVEKPAPPVVEKPVILAYNQRKENVIQTIEVSSDSLVLSFYDNGVIDGDSISVYVNGQNILPATRLTATAIKKTIAIPQGQDVRITLTAESLGTIPPNTGLLVVKDGENSFQLNFSADMQTNAAIVLRRKP